MYDVEKQYAERESLQKHRLVADDLMLPMEVLSSAQVAELLAGQNVVLNF